MSDAAVQIAYVAEGKLYVKRGDRAAQMVESTFAQNMIDRAAQLADRHGWRNKEMEGGGFFTQGLIWGKGAPRRDVRQVRITGLSKMPQEGSLVYTLDMGAVGGLFTYDLNEQYENRLFHKQEFRGADLAHHPVKNIVALSLPREDGTASIALMEPGGKGLRPITEGDSLDQAPSWVREGEDLNRELLVYQSAGIARDSHGHMAALGPYAICKLDLDKETLNTVLEDGRWDYLVPRVRNGDGGEQMYYIRRPYKAAGHGSYSPLKLIVDILLFPFRLLRAIFFFLNFFSMMFTKKPLTAAGGPKTDPMDGRFMMLHGKWIDAEKAMKAAAKGKPVSLVPSSWELMRMDAAGKSVSLASGVLSFDLAPDGTVIYTNGSEIYAIGKDGKAERVCAHRMIQQVIAI